MPDSPRLDALGDGEVCDAFDEPIAKQQLILEGVVPTPGNKKPIRFLRPVLSVLGC